MGACKQYFVTGGGDNCWLDFGERRRYEVVTAGARGAKHWRSLQNKGYLYGGMPPS